MPMWQPNGFGKIAAQEKRYIHATRAKGFEHEVVSCRGKKRNIKIIVAIDVVSKQEKLSVLLLRDLSA